ncbi:MAG: hypothetical protein ACFE0J_17710 [Elainellaceae cyanobacterium]
MAIYPFSRWEINRESLLFIFSAVEDEIRNTLPSVKSLGSCDESTVLLAVQLVDRKTVVENSSDSFSPESSSPARPAEIHSSPSTENGFEGDRPPLDNRESVHESDYELDHDLDAQQLDLAERNLALKERKIQLRAQIADLEAYEKTIFSSRTSRRIQHITQGIIGVVMLGTGIAFTATDHMIGPYFIGVGAAASFSLKDTVQLGRPASLDQHDESV